jgi:Domain of unknown function (DUF6647)
VVKLASLCSAVLTTCVMIGSFEASAEVQRDRLQYSVELATIRLPGTNFDVAVGSAVLDQSSMQIEPKLIKAIAVWLSHNFDLPFVAQAPRIAFVPAKVIGALRYGSEADLLGNTLDVVAVYMDENKTIYLPEQWTGSTPAELSILVHEMVHHLQKLTGMRYGCAEAREKLAYQAQQEWLALFGADFFVEFDTDPFTLLVRTECPI